MQIGLEQLEALLKTLEDKKVAEFEYEDEKIRLRVALGRAAVVSAAPVAVSAPSPSPASMPAAAAVDVSDPNVVFVTSPLVGTFYGSPSPDAASFVDAGAQVKKGQPLCIIEAMKLMNEIEAEFPCTILEVLAENGKSVEFGQKLFKVKKS